MALYGGLAEFTRQGKELLCTSGALSALGVLDIATDFATIDSVSAMLEGDTAPTTNVLTYSVDGSTVTISGWMPTATADTALVASDGEETVSVVIIGRRRQ